MSKYIDIANSIEHDIITGHYHRQLPNQAILAKKYSTTRVTIAKSLKLLEDRELTTTIKGHGTYILQNLIPDFYINSPANVIDGLTGHIQGGGGLKSNIISFDIRKPTEEEARALEINLQDDVYDIIRQRIFNSKPLKLEYTIMPTKVIPGINQEILHSSIYAYIQQKLGLKISCANRMFSADKPDAYDIKFLDCQPDTPVFVVHQKAMLADGRPFEFSETRNRFDRGSMTIKGFAK